MSEDLHSLRFSAADFKLPRSREGESSASTNLRAERGLTPSYFSQEPVSEAVQPPRLLEEDLKNHHLLQAFSSKKMSLSLLKPQELSQQLGPCLRASTSPAGVLCVLV